MYESIAKVHQMHVVFSNNTCSTPYYLMRDILSETNSEKVYSTQCMCVTD